ncbi:MAG: NUDIX domain-containing protein [Candidatus Thiodiazotropha sp. (ex Epidulcina cf. delphinae)]|nr:NUDIX domain-containing protein [Candidatus Thiodiazotropha sp. (ex Epidulcina cf. delphinae)]
MNHRSPPEALEPAIRNAVRAVIVRDEMVLMQKKWAEKRGAWYTLPGGGQDVHETLAQALIRECEEEIGATVEIGALVWVADFFKRRDTAFPSYRHVVEFLFACSLPESYRPNAGPHPDKHQIDVVWLPFSVFPDVELFPQDLVHRLPALTRPDTPTYLGVID